MGREGEGGRESEERMKMGWENERGEERRREG